MKPQWLDDFKLDDESGPAPPLGATDADTLAAKVIERSFSTGGLVGSHFRWGPSLLLIVGAVFAIVAAGVYRSEYAKNQPCASGPCLDRRTEASPVSVAIEAPSPNLAASGSTAPPVESLPLAALPSVIAEPVSSGRPMGSGKNFPSQPVTPSDMLLEANRARRDFQWARAGALYERVMSSRADESYAATIALASIRLEHENDPRGALALYERALAARPGGPLSAQAEAGAARCRRALADTGRSSP